MVLPGPLALSSGGCIRRVRLRGSSLRGFPGDEFILLYCRRGEPLVRDVLELFSGGVISGLCKL